MSECRVRTWPPGDGRVVKGGRVIRVGLVTGITVLCLAKTGALREINNIAAAISARLCYKS